MLSRTIGAVAAAVIAIGAVTAVATAQSPDGPAMVMETDLGPILVGPNGMTLYSFDNDDENVSNCYGGCATNWPPFYVEEGAVAEGDWTIVERTDDNAMWAYKGMPLYYWINDTAPGDTTGDGVGGVWHVVVVEDAM
ncbi:MAG: hypothetical protein KIS96_04250 [Bauldia sp.]|nr:hypothetical protein [Bauldia sp.]